MAGSNGLLHLVNFGTFVFLARILGPSDIGLAAFALVIIDTVRLLIVSGIPDALIRSDRWDNSLATGAFVFLLSIGLVLIGLACLLVLIFHREGAAPSGLDIFAALSPLFLIEALSVVPEALLRRRLMFRSLSIRNVMSTLTTGLIGIALALFGWGVWSLVASRLIGAVLASALTWSASRWTPQRGASFQDLRNLLAFTGWLTMAQLVGQLSYRIPDFAIGTILGPAALATYRVGARIVDVALQVVVHPFQQTSLPFFCSEHTKDQLETSYRELSSGLVILLYPIFFSLSVCGPDLVLVFFGPKWASSGQVLTVIPLSCVAAALIYLSSPALIAVGKIRSIFALSVVVTVASLPAFVLASFGVTYVAASAVLRDCITLPVILYVLRRDISLKLIPLFRLVAPTFACALIIYIATTILKGAMEPGIVRLTAILLCSAGGYATLLWLLDPRAASRATVMIRRVYNRNSASSAY